MRDIAGREDDNFVMKARYDGVFKVKQGEEVACILLVIPPSIGIDGATNLRELLERGCHQVGGGIGRVRRR